jgi:hypothetical protein
LLVPPLQPSASTPAPVCRARTEGRELILRSDCVGHVQRSREHKNDRKVKSVLGAHGRWASQALAERACRRARG